MSKPTELTFPYGGKTLRVIDYMGEPKFDLSALCDILTLPVNRIRNLLSYEHTEWLYEKTVRDDKGKEKVEYYVTEAGMFYVILSLDTDTFRDTQNWVCKTVLPKIKAEYTLGLTTTNMGFPQTYFDEKFAQLESKITLYLNSGKNTTKSNDGGVTLQMNLDQNMTKCNNDLDTLEDLRKALNSALRKNGNTQSIKKADLVCVPGNLSLYLLGAGYLGRYYESLYTPTEKGKACGIVSMKYLNTNTPKNAKYRAEFRQVIFKDITSKPYDTVKTTIKQGENVKPQRPSIF